MIVPKQRKLSASYEKEKELCVKYFEQWSESDQVEFVEHLISQMCHYQHGHINSYPWTQWCHPTISSTLISFSFCLQSFLASRSFLMSLALRIRLPKYWRFSLSISPSNEYSGLISFRIDWFDLTLQGILKSLLQHHSSKASILWWSAFFMVQISHPYVTTGKAIVVTNTNLCRQSNVSAF